jgi:hypothetical protein
LRFRFILIILPLVFSILGPADLSAQEGRPEISVTAWSMRSMPDGTLTAEGEVLVKGEGVTVRADNLRYNSGSDTLILTGNVVMEEDGGGSFTGDTLALDLADLTGGISRGEIIIVPNGFRVRGEDINRIGPEEYSIRKGVFTSCPGDCPDWSFTASRIQVRREGYLEARHAAFRIVGIPVFYTPYLLYPVKTKRQTGLLFPELRFSDETGIESVWPLFITMGPHADATVSPRTFSRDSFGLGLDSRYRLNWGAGGQIKGFAMTGERPERWYLGAEHSMALKPDLWLRGRWYDTGDPAAAALFGDAFEERYPGAVYRHASLEGDHGILGYNLQTSSLLTDGVLARSDVPGTNLKRDMAVIRFGPGGGKLWRAGIQAEDTQFDGGEGRTLVSPTLALRIPGPWKLSGNIEGRGIIGTNGKGSTEDEAYIFSVAEKIAVESSGDWGRHRADLEVTASATRGAAFGGSVLRDSKDLVQERRIIDARVHSLLTSSGFRWDLTAGRWQDHELDLVLDYGITSLSYWGIFMKASRNRDADFGLLLPSLAVDEDSLKGWQVEAGYESEALGFAVGRDSAEGFPEMLSAKGHFTLAGVSVSVGSYYDMDADTLADETIAVKIPGRCWTVGVGRSRSPDKTGWSLQLELGM